MNTYFIAKNCIKDWSEDSYENGCLFKTGGCIGIDIEFFGDSIPELLSRLQSYFSVDSDDILLNSCGETGRIDIQLLEDENSEKASPHQMTRWKAGKQKLYLAAYTFSVYQITERIVDLTT